MRDWLGRNLRKRNGGKVFVLIGMIFGIPGTWDEHLRNVEKMMTDGL